MYMFIQYSAHWLTGCFFTFAQRLVDKELGLLGHVEALVLGVGRPALAVAFVHRRRALENLDDHAAALSGHDEARVLAAEAPVLHARHSVLALDLVDQVLVLVDVHLLVGERHHHGLVVLLLVVQYLHGQHTGWQLNGPQLLALSFK